MPKTREDDVFVSEVDGACPCGGHWYAGRTKKSNEQCVVHSMPYCKEYEKLEIQDYLKWIREGIEGKRTN